ncbi:CarB family protein [Planococcus donghaensis MPA1U2]|uniref:CarB family protein n=1 Tax=Planococcus donghaensis MPA1U2 TaxID=933115 RepID=E7RDR8_9BACL|nr:ATP-grasp domain-containing protein [Planococcus donghaensis]EGA90824.1 CarB family protein [Planococcus donghaensis MPA1U2]
MKKILVLGSGFLQSFLIKKAKELGYYVLTIDRNPNAVGFKYADYYDVIDIVDQEACLKFALEHDVDGVVTAATDYGVLSAAYIAQEMNLPGINYEVAKLIKNKYEVRRVLNKYKIDDVKQFFEISNTTDLYKISAEIRFPVMVKPCDGSGSKAAKRVDTILDLKKACTDAISSSLIGKALIEDFISGKEYGIETFIYNKEVYILGILDKYMTEPPIYAELGHSMPSQLNSKQKVEDVVKKAIEVLGIDCGAVNMDVLITEDNHVCIVDIGVRMGGNLIGSHIIPKAREFDYIGNLIHSSVGNPVDMKMKATKVVVTRLLALKPGLVLSLPSFNKIEEREKVKIYHNLEEGSVIKEYRNNLDGHGYIVAEGDDLEEVKNRCDSVKRIIDLNIERVIS